MSSTGRMGSKTVDIQINKVPFNEIKKQLNALGEAKGIGELKNSIKILKNDIKDFEISNVGKRSMEDIKGIAESISTKFKEISRSGFFSAEAVATIEQYIERFNSIQKSAERVVKVTSDWKDGLVSGIGNLDILAGIAEEHGTNMDKVRVHTKELMNIEKLSTMTQKEKVEHIKGAIEPLQKFYALKKGGSKLVGEESAIWKDIMGTATKVAEAHGTVTKAGAARPRVTGGKEAIVAGAGMFGIGELASIATGGLTFMTAVKVFEQAVKMHDGAIRAQVEARAVLATPGAETAAGMTAAEFKKFYTDVYIEGVKKTHRITHEEIFKFWGSMKQRGVLDEMLAPLGDSAELASLTMTDVMKKLKNMPEESAKAMTEFIGSLYNLSTNINVSFDMLISGMDELNRIQFTGRKSSKNLAEQFLVITIAADKVNVAYKDMIKWTTELSKTLRFYGLDSKQTAMIVKDLAEGLRSNLYTVQELTNVMHDILVPSYEDSALTMQYLIEHMNEYGKETQEMISNLNEMNPLTQNLIMTMINEKKSLGEIAKIVKGTEIGNMFEKLSNNLKVSDAVQNDIIKAQKSRLLDLARKMVGAEGSEADVLAVARHLTQGMGKTVGSWIAAESDGRKITTKATTDLDKTIKELVEHEKAAVDMYGKFIKALDPTTWKMDFKTRMIETYVKPIRDFHVEYEKGLKSWGVALGDTASETKNLTTKFMALQLALGKYISTMTGTGDIANFNPLLKSDKSALEIKQ